MIECDGYRGRVSSLGYRSTMIETLDGSIIAFQNSQLFNKNFRNMTRNHKFECVKVEVGISYGTDVERARKIILETLATLPFLSKVKKTSVVLDSFGDSAVNLGVWVWVPVMTKSSSLSSVREHIYNAFNEHGISIPFPQQDLYVKEFPGGAPCSRGPEHPLPYYNNHVQRPSDSIRLSKLLLYQSRRRQVGILPQPRHASLHHHAGHP